jgi:hypothetical protein
MKEGPSSSVIDLKPPQAAAGTWERPEVKFLRAIGGELATARYRRDLAACHWIGEGRRTLAGTGSNASPLPRTSVEALQVEKERPFTLNADAIR